MLLPRFSLRATLLGTTVCAVFFLIVGQAVRGQPWAIVITVAVLSLALLFIFHAMLYLVSSALARLVGSQQVLARTIHGGVQSSSDQQSPPELEATLSTAQSDSPVDRVSS